MCCFDVSAAVIAGTQVAVSRHATENLCILTDLAPKPTMCGRFTLRSPAADVARYFDLAEIPLLEPRYNIAPTQAVAVVRADATARRRLDRLVWGLVPSWASDPAIGTRLINARAETVADKPAFRQAFRQRRCLVVADGFYEWQGAGRQKQPYYLTAAGGGPFALAGLWEQWQRDGQTIGSCTIITTAANDCVQQVHDRMPVILAPDAWPRWLDPGVNEPEWVQPLLKPCPAETLVAFPVSTAVNRATHDQSDCIEPLSQTTVDRPTAAQSQMYFSLDAMP